MPLAWGQTTWQYLEVFLGEFWEQVVVDVLGDGGGPVAVFDDVVGAGLYRITRQRPTWGQD